MSPSAIRSSPCGRADDTKQFAAPSDLPSSFEGQVSVLSAFPCREFYPGRVSGHRVFFGGLSQSGNFRSVLWIKGKKAAKRPASCLCYPQNRPSPSFFFSFQVFSGNNGNTLPRSKFKGSAFLLRIKNPLRRSSSRGFINQNSKNASDSLTRAGSDLLFRVLRQSTIGVKGFHCRVRDGIECFSFAITTGSSKTVRKVFFFFYIKRVLSDLYIRSNEQVNQAISTDRLHASLRFHPRPINVVVFHGLNGDTLF